MNSEVIVRPEMEGRRRPARALVDVDPLEQESRPVVDNQRLLVEVLGNPESRVALAEEPEVRLPVDVVLLGEPCA
ncbi:MAG: hypothetical protein BRD24_01995 [Halobacteriales archaeon SW_9_67_24]|nr:MAG: hypothetical protein BRD24_01995 [Halobacteriales archaeon SW_9_67_24]